MYMSRPALSACGQLSFVQPSTWPCAFQSPTVKPSKFMRFLSTSVIRPLLPVMLDAVPARKGDHDGLHAGFDRRHVTRVVDVAQLGLGDLRIALVATVFGAAVGQEVFGGGDHVRAAQEIRAARLALQSLHEDAGVRGDDAGIFRITFVGAAPAIVLRHGDRGRERPVDAGGAHLFGGDTRDVG